MSGLRRGPPQQLSRAFRWLLPGDLGAEACEELESAYKSMRERRSGVVAWAWLFGHLFRPSTWALAWALRRRRTPGRGEANLPSPPRRSWAVISALDVKLGLRMLAKHPGLSLVGGFGMAVAIAMGALVGTIATAAYAPLPFDEGRRVVAIEVWDQAVNNQERRILHDYESWHEELKSVEDLVTWAGGSPGRALALAREAAKDVGAILQRVLQGQLDPYLATAQVLEAPGEFRGATPSAQMRNRTRAALDLMLAVFRDGVRAAQGVPSESLAHGDLARMFHQMGICRRFVVYNSTSWANYIFFDF